MSLKLAARLVPLVPIKVADLQENDTTAHIEDLSFILPEGTKAIIIRADRQSGTGYFYAYPVSGPTYTIQADDITAKAGCFLPIKNREIKWKNNVANDDWDLMLLGYFVQRRTR